MPIELPNLDDRKYQQLLDDALARIPVHTPEWTNFNESDPGVTVIEVFAFLTESLLYRCNQIPERNRKKFLKLLGVPLQAASSAKGLVQFTNERGPLETITLNANLEVRAGQIPFRTEQGLDVLPIEARMFYKRKVTNPDSQLIAYYNQLYASFFEPQLPSIAELYETTPFPTLDASAVDLGQDAIDNALWVALIVRKDDKDRIAEVKRKIGGKTLSLGVVGSPAEIGLKLTPTGRNGNTGASLLKFEMPVGERLSDVKAERVPRYRLLTVNSNTDVLTYPGIIQIALPAHTEMNLWDNLEPLESGVGNFPPPIDDTDLSDRIVTWIRVSAPLGSAARILWAGINATLVAQRARVVNELIPEGTGAPDQTVVLSKTPVIPGSVQLTVTANDQIETWKEIEDLTLAGPEVPVRDAKNPPGSPVVVNPLVKVFTLNAEAGEIRFGDGLRGARPPFGASLRADYDYGVGRDGNVNANAINTSPVLPAGLKVTNPVATWGGAEAETVSEGEKQISRYLQHRDRMVSHADFKTITERTPGVDIGRVEVLSAFHPELGSNTPGDAPGAVTLMVIPKFDALNPDAPMPDSVFLETICQYINPRRLVTTEVFLRGPEYKSIYLSVGISVVAGFSIAEVREAVKQELLDFLSPLPVADDDASDKRQLNPDGWPLAKPVVALELLAVASRVPGVLLIHPNVLLAVGTGAAVSQVDMRGLNLPHVAGISVAVGDPISLDDLRGTTPTTGGGSGGGQGDGAAQRVPVPVVPEECK